MRQPRETILINRTFRVLAESADWIVVDKPAHLLIHPTGPQGIFTLWEGLRELLAFEIASGGQVSIINRLDRETSGLVLAAKHSSAAKTLHLAMQARSDIKKYLALVVGHPAWESTEVDAPILRQGSVQPSKIYLKQLAHPAGLPAKTKFQVLKKFTAPTGQSYTLLEAAPETGRTHQIRVHCALLGHSIVGDKIYGPDENCYLEFITTGWTDQLAAQLVLPRHALHSANLALPEMNLSWSSPLAPDLEKWIASLSCSQR